ncbi:MAG TPA: cobalt ECF transporter T component CbiQ [Thermoleophilia bacterium]|nr:cobalt ECF transporter T component CbiQ [Thermoleophilia bacterium]
MTGTHHFLTDQRIGASPIHRLDPRAKIVGFLTLTVVGVSTPATEVWAFALYYALLLFLVGLSRLPLAFVVRRAALVLPVVAVVAVFMPFFHGGGGRTFHVLGGVEVTEAGLMLLSNVLLKAALGALSAIVLGLTTSFGELIVGLDGLRVPRIFTLIVSFMYRYSFVFTEESRRMHRAMESRNYRGRWLWDAKVIGHMVSALFLRSYHRGERVYVAMISRGYDGTMPAASPPGIHSAEVVFVVCLTLALGAIRTGAAL